MIIMIASTINSTSAYETQNIYSYDFEKLYNASIFLVSNSQGLNDKFIQQLSILSKLETNWDGDDALPPFTSCILKAEQLLNTLNSKGEKISMIAPGPNGEIMIEMNNKYNGNSLEIIFYEKKSVFVKFPKEGCPEQGNYEKNILPDLIKWIYGGEKTTN